MLIHCCGCKKDTDAVLVSGVDVYPKRDDLKNLPFWQCKTCQCFVGCHHKTKNSTKPLGVIATPEIKFARRQIHKILDPLWKEKKLSRKDLYARISDKLGYEYHTAEIKDIVEARRVYLAVRSISRNLL